ncbi:hypothetical protein ABF78_20205 [Enterobacter asburiae]|nr:hypothetical protein ABF78_20205 [Enterobacter asburiae]
MSQLEKLYQAAIENEQKLAELEAHLAALAAENAGLKSAIEKHADSYIMCGYCRTERDGKNDDVCEVLDSIPATDAFLAEVRAHDLNAFIRHHSAELDAHIKNGGEQFDEKSVRIRDIIVSARLFREQIRKEAAK